MVEVSDYVLRLKSPIFRKADSPHVAKLTFWISEKPS